MVPATHTKLGTGGSRISEKGGPILDLPKPYSPFLLQVAEKAGVGVGEDSNTFFRSASYVKTYNQRVGVGR